MFGKKKIVLMSAAAVLAMTGAAPAQTAACPSGQIKTRVIGGKDAGPGDYPFQAFVLANNMLCGGTLISPTAILTAGHCVTQKNSKTKLAATAFSIRLDSIEAFSGGEYHSAKAGNGVAKVILHPDYNPMTYENDIAILELSKASAIAPVKLEGVSAPAIGDAQFAATRGRVLGWGRVDTADPFSTSSILKFAPVPVVTNKNCTLPANFSQYGAIDVRRVCAGGEGDVDTCNGDSGGPLLMMDGSQNLVQLGITSFGSQICAQKGVYGVYTRVGTFAPWVKNNTKFASAGGETAQVAWTGDKPRSDVVTALGAAAPARQAVMMNTIAAAAATAVPPLSVWANGETDAPVTLIPAVSAASSASNADYVWNIAQATVTRRGTLVAEGVTDIGRLSGVLGKWRALPLMTQLASGKPKVSVSLGATPAGGVFADGAIVEPKVMRPSDPSLKYLTLFDLTSDGSVDYLYPMDSDGDGAMEGDYTLDQTKVQCPFGSDHIVAIVTPDRATALRRQLKEVAGKNTSAAYTAATVLQGNLKGNYAVGFVELLTAPKR